MAIKGKSRKRSRARTAASPPKPTIGARKTAMPMRRDVKRAAVVVLAILSLLGGLRVWQNTSRSDALRVYDAKLRQAQQPLFKHFAQEASTNFDQSIQVFQSGSMDAAAFLTLANQWETDFRNAEDAIKKLKAPNKVAVEAQKLIILGVDGYVGIARLYNLAAQFRQIADGEKDVTKKKALNDKVQVVLQHADEWRKERVDPTYADGSTMLNDLKIEYGLEKPIQPSGTST